MSSFHLSLNNKRISPHCNGVDLRFVNLGLNSRPTFFGCNASNFTSYPRTPPLVVYFPHAPWTAFTNYSTFTLQYSPSEVQAYITNGVAAAVSSSSIAIVSRTSLKETVPRGLHAWPVRYFNAQRNGRVLQWVINARNVSRNIAGMEHSTLLPTHTIRCSNPIMGRLCRMVKEVIHRPRIQVERGDLTRCLFWEPFWLQFWGFSWYKGHFRLVYA
jgi:hypothetical protein